MLPSTQNYLELNLSICYPRDLKLFYTKLSGIKFDNLLSKRFKVVLQHLNAALLKVGLWTWIKKLRCAHHGILVVEIWRKKIWRKNCNEKFRCLDLGIFRIFIQISGPNCPELCSCIITVMLDNVSTPLFHKCKFSLVKLMLQFC